jgi:hypothetical protein
MATLDELLALIPDEPEGNITAEDLRTIVSDLYGASHTLIDHFAFEWVTSATPPAGKISLTGGWSMSASALLMAEMTSDGEATPFGLMDLSDLPVPFLLSTQGRTAYVRGTVTGPAVDQGSYRTVPITVSAIQGVAPAANTPLLFFIAGSWQAF